MCGIDSTQAVRAIRNPERYGPRSADPLDPSLPGQTRTAGITRAILDTFPVIKYAVAPRTTEASVHDPKTADLEAGDGEVIQMQERKPHSEDETGDELGEEPGPSSARASGEIEGSSSDSRPRSVITPAPDPAPVVLPAADEAAAEAGAELGHGTCPICILDFEEGDDLRVLPCEGRHKFHKDCVDQWLLESSGSCPLCREGVHFFTVDGHS